jgi:hypothetical protein
MCDEFIHPGLVEDNRLSRRGFGLTAAALASIPGSALAQANVTEKDVSIKTPDGTCDAVLYVPNGQGSWPAVLIWPDIMGLRPAFRDMGRRLAAEGLAVIVCGRDGAQLDAVAAGVRGRAIVADLSDAASRDALLAAAGDEITKFGGGEATLTTTVSAIAPPVQITSGDVTVTDGVAEVVTILNQ